MRRHAGLASVLGLTALGVCFLTVARARDDDDDKKAAAAAGQEVQKLAEAAGTADLKTQADAAAKKYELKPIMWAFKPKDKGGLTDRGIELELIALGKKPLKDLPKQAADLEKTAKITQGVAAVTPHYADKFTKTPADAKAWKDLCDQMDKGSEELAAAVKGGDPKAVQTAANHLNGSCNDCHTKFRDN